jgi:hypothetical protein
MPLRKTTKSLQLTTPLISMAFILGTLLNHTALAETYPELSLEQENWIGQQIFNNECAMQISCLTAWNLGEDFPSLGIAHFIWYKENQREIFEESFPELLAYFESQNISIPTWIENSNHESPWQNRDEFNEKFSGSELSKLRGLLADTFPQQTAFIIQRFGAALNRMIAILPENEVSNIEDKFYKIANSNLPYGMYALIDYVNFKGEGISLNERYAEQGWGLLQVLEKLPDNSENILEDFIISAKTVLQDRVSNAPPLRNEQQWLQGWHKRIETYLPDPTALNL